MGAGRPTDYNQSIADEICERLSEGESLRNICREKGMPSKAAVFRWLGKFPEFSDQYARAREDQAENFADELINISDEATPENAQVAKLQIDTRKWVASKLKAKKYGDSTQIKHADADGNKIEGLDIGFIASKKEDNPS